MKQSYRLVAALIIISIAGFAALYSQVLPGKKIINFRDPINSMGDDYSPTLTGDGNTLIFNSRLKDEKIHNIFISQLTRNGWTKPEYMKDINSTENDETPFITPDGKTIIFASDRKGSIRPSVTADGAVRITFDLYISNLIDGRWTKPVPVAGDVNTQRNERCPSLTADRKYLFFSRWRYSNIRRSVIMVAELKDNRYVNPVELPPSINTYNYDLALSPSKNGEGFYFSSRRPGGYGGWDLYFTRFKEGKYEKPVNLGPRVNSPDNELFLTEAGKELFFCSNRIGGLGGYDIYSTGYPAYIEKKKAPEKKNVPPIFEKKEPAEEKKPAEEKVPAKKEIPEKKEGDTGKKSETANDPNINTRDSMHREAPPVEEKEKVTIPDEHDEKEAYEEQEDPRTRIQFNIISSETGKPVILRFRVYLKDTDDPKADAIRVIKRKSDADGSFIIYPKEDVTNVVIKLDEKGFYLPRTEIDVTPGDRKNLDVEVTPDMKKEIDFIFRPVYFSFKSSHIKLTYYPYLHTIINYMRKNRDVEILITGHADFRGSSRSNYMVSIRRARALKDYFVKMGLDENRFRVKGMGSKRPLTRKPGNVFYELNRRVEFTVIE